MSTSRNWLDIPEGKTEWYSKDPDKEAEAKSFLSGKTEDFSGNFFSDTGESGTDSWDPWAGDQNVSHFGPKSSSWTDTLIDNPGGRPRVERHYESIQDSKSDNRDSEWTVNNEGKTLFTGSRSSTFSPSDSEGLSPRAASMYRRAGLDPHTDPRSERQFDVRNRVTAFTGATPEGQGSVGESRFSSAPTVARFGQSATNWWNQGRNVRIPNESSAGWGQLWRDDRAQLGKSDANFAAGRRGNPLGRPDQAFNPFRSAEKGGPGSGPTPLVRQVGERILGPIATGASIFAQGQEGSALNQAVESSADYVPGLRANPETDIGKRTGEFLARQAGNVRDTFVDALGNIRRGTKTTATGQAVPKDVPTALEQQASILPSEVGQIASTETGGLFGLRNNPNLVIPAGRNTIPSGSKRELEILNYQRQLEGLPPVGEVGDQSSSNAPIYDEQAPIGTIVNSGAYTHKKTEEGWEDVTDQVSGGAQNLAGLGATNQPATVDLNSSKSGWDPGSDPAVAASDKAITDAEAAWRTASNNQQNYLGGRTAGTQEEFEEYMRLQSLSDAASKRLDLAYAQQAEAMKNYTSS